MKRTLVALLAIVAAVAIVALFAWAQDPTKFDGNVESTGTITGTTITASTGFTGDLTGAVTGNVTGNLTGDVTGNLTGDVTGAVFQTAALKGNLPTAGDNTGEFFKNTTGDTGWVADNDSWVQLWP